MKRSKFTDEQILAIVKEGEAGRKVADLCRTHGITEQTYYRWKAKYGGMELSEMQRLKQVEDENRRLKQIVAEQTLGHPGAQGGRRKKVVGPIARREAVGWLQTRGTSLRRACRVIGLSTATWRYQRRTSRDESHRAGSPPGPRGAARTVWLSTAAHSARARRAAGESQTRPSDLSSRGLAGAPTASEAADASRPRAVADGRANGWSAGRWTSRRTRSPTGAGFARSTSSMTSRANVSPSKSTARCLGSASRACSIACTRMVGLPKTIVVDNGPEFAGRTLDAWAYARGVELRFIRPGKPIENAYVESFNGKFRDECLNEHWFISLADAKAAIEAWRVDYNTVRPHSSLAGRTPDQFAAISGGARRPRPARTNEALKPEDLALSV